MSWHCQIPVATTGLTTILEFKADVYLKSWPKTPVKLHRWLIIYAHLPLFMVSISLAAFGAEIHEITGLMLECIISCRGRSTLNAGWTVGGEHVCKGLRVGEGWLLLPVGLGSCRIGSAVNIPWGKPQGKPAQPWPFYTHTSWEILTNMKEVHRHQMWAGFLLKKSSAPATTVWLTTLVLGGRA